MLKFPLSVLLIFSCSASAQPMQSSAIHLDVVSIKENRSVQEKGYVEIPPNGNRIIVRNTPMYRVIGFAFGKQRNDLIEGLPEWTHDLRWDIEATVAEESLQAFRAMPFEKQKEVLQQVLAERCQFTAHPGEKEIPVFALKIAKSGLKMRSVPAEEEKSSSRPGALPVGWDISQSRGKISARGLPMDGLVYALSRADLSRQIVDRTGLVGRYDIQLVWTPDDNPEQAQAGDSPDMAPPRIFKALEEQLGLRLEATRALVPAVIVTHIDRPSAN